MSHYPNIPTTHQGYHNTDAADNLASRLEKGVNYGRSTLDLIRRLCQALEAERITYCHWKSNNALDRSASGDNDLDLLVSRADIPPFTEILSQLGFKQAKAPVEKQLPGVLDYYGYDEAADRLVHVHAHYQLILGHDATKNYRLPVEQPYLESAVQDGLFKVPAPEFEFIVLVIRMMLKHSTWDVILGGDGTLKTAERRELTYLLARINQERVSGILKQHFPYISADLFNNCIQALQPACSAWMRMRTGLQLQTKLQASSRRPVAVDIYLKLWRKVAWAVRRRIFKSSSKCRLESGGAMIAIVGGDGAGKSTAVDALYDWLSKYFATTRVHMGKPSWSWPTITVRVILKIGNLLGLYPEEASVRETLNQKSLVSPGYPWLLREICRARDRYWLYVRARRFAANGGLVVLDRFPLPQIQLMDGPQAGPFLSQLQLMDGPQADQFMKPRQASRLAQRLVKLEESYYHQIVSPELLTVLRVDPEIAVQRKTDEDATFVRERSTGVWELNWDYTQAHVIDASRPQAEVLSELKSLIWSRL